MLLAVVVVAMIAGRVATRGIHSDQYDYKSLISKFYAITATYLLRL